MICAIHAADRPLVVQFAASNADDFGRAAEMVAPYADAVDLNCGCPQRSAGQPLPWGGGGGGGGREGGRGGEGREEGGRGRKEGSEEEEEEEGEGGGRGEGRGAARRAEGGRAREQSSHCPSFAVRCVLLWKVYLPGKKISDFQLLTVSQVGHGGGHWCTFDQQAGVGV